MQNIDKAKLKKIFELVMFLIMVESIVMSVMDSPKHLILGIIAYGIGNQKYDAKIGIRYIELLGLITIILISKQLTSIWTLCAAIIIVIDLICILGAEGKYILTGFIMCGLVVFSLINTYYYSNTRNSIATTFKNEQQINTELSKHISHGIENTEVINKALKNEQAYKDNLYKVIETIREDKNYMLDINGTEQTKWEKIGYLESVALEFIMDYGDKEYSSITTDKIYDTDYVNKSIEKYNSSKTGV